MKKKVSLFEEQQDSRPPSRGEEEDKEDDVEEKEKDSPLVALAPDVSIPEEQPPATTDVSACLAFQCLDEGL
ncbi:hypothetical protein L3Q82_000570 [Scortum barcoo]|uniref:Uncharacterized protein n=1 Tax=Scortum barcoo TaxID=214431 RepID=A0ACB8WFF4_9TELE|nr:hypothetical protein L3Q82_000570 [Scortum barcoo]